MNQRSSAATTGAKAKGKVDKGEKPPAKTDTRWRGDAVEPAGPAGQSAEEAAARAEGNEPLRADEAAQAKDRGTFLDRGPRRRPAQGADDAENAEEKRQSAAEDHAAVPGHGPIRGRL